MKHEGFISSIVGALNAHHAISVDINKDKPPTRGLNDFMYVKSFLFTYTHYSLIIEMIDISQWRVSIGLWACHQISYSTCSKVSPNADNSTIDGLTTIRRIKDLTFTLGLFLLLLLILSGDIEINPGPKTGNLL